MSPSEVYLTVNRSSLQHLLSIDSMCGSEKIKGREHNFTEAIASAVVGSATAESWEF